MTRTIKNPSFCAIRFRIKILLNTRGIQKVMHSKAMLVQDLTNLVCIWHKRDRTHLFAIVICFSLIFRFLKLKLDLEMAAPLKARQKQNAKAKLWPLFFWILKM